MKNFKTFVKENLEEVKNDIATKVENSETTEKDKENMETKDKPNEDIQNDISSQIEKIEVQKKNINDRINIFNKQISNTKDTVKTQELTKQVQDLKKELTKFDGLLKDANKQKETLNK